MKFPILPLAILLFSCEVEQENLVSTATPIKLPHPTSSIEAIRERVLQSENGFVEFSREEDSLWVEAFVTSSDEGGNFFKEIYVQDKHIASNTALKILMDRTALSDYYPKGSQLVILLNGLGAGFNNNVLTLGSYQGNNIGHISEYLLKDHVKKSDSLYSITAKSIDLSAMDRLHIGQWIAIDGVQFAAAEEGKTYAGEAFDVFDGERRMVQCKDQHAIMMSTSTYADYKTVLLPLQSGRIEGVLTLDYYGEHYILKINDPNDIDFREDRCDPFFEESFDHVRLGSFDQLGWTNFNQEGSQLWEVYEDENSLGQSIRLGSYRSGDAATVSWLITPEIDVGSLNQPHLAFRTSTSFADNSVLEVFYSTEWSGEVAQLENTQWVSLPARLATKGDDTTHWIDSGDLAIDFGPKFHLAFRYTGSGKSTYDGTFEIDDIRFFDRP